MPGDLETLFARVLGIPPSEIDQSSSIGRTRNWDSMATVALVSAIEERFGIEMTTDEMASLRSLADARAILSSRGLGGA